MSRVGDMNVKDFLELISNKYVTHKDLEKFATKDELRRVAKQASTHSTNIIRDAVSETYEEFVERCEKLSDNNLIKMGFNPNKPQEMQDTMSFIRNEMNNKKHDRNAFVASFLKVVIGGLVFIFVAGLGVYLGKLI